MKHLMFLVMQSMCLRHGYLFTMMDRSITGMSGPPSMCDLIRDGCCGIGARNGLSELHLSHNLITESMVDNLLDATGKAIAACGGRLRQPFYLRMELNSTLEGIDPKRFSEDDGKRGFKICLSAGYQKSGCNIKHCRHGADVHLILSKM